MEVTAESKVVMSVQPFQSLAGILMTIIGVIMLSVVGIIYLINGTVPLNDFEQVHLNLPYLIPGAGGIIFTLVGVITLIFQRRKKKRILKVLRNGSLKEGKVLKNVQNFYYRVNDIPQRKVTFLSGDDTYVYKFFGEDWASLFQVNTVFQFRHDNKGNAYPDPGFLDDLLNNGPKIKESIAESFEEGSQKMIKAAEKMLENGDKESALTFYDAAYSFQANQEVKEKIIVLANELNDVEMLKKYSSKV